MTPERYEPLPSLPELPGFLWRKLGRPGRWGVALALVAVVALAALTIPGLRRSDREQAGAEAQRVEAARAERFARLTREARPRTAVSPDRSRGALIALLETRVLADARERDRRGELRGPFRSVSCSPYPKGTTARGPRSRLECLAVTSEVPAGERTTGSLIGQPFRAVVDTGRGRVTWCKIVQRPGELAASRRPVLIVPDACGG